MTNMSKNLMPWSADDKILYRFTPDPPTTEVERRRYVYEDVAEEYVIIEYPDALSGIVVYAYFESREKWIANPALRPLVAHLLKFALLEMARRGEE